MPPEPIIEFFDRASMPPEIAELLDAWPEIVSGTAWLVRLAVMPREPRRMRRAWDMLFARAELARVLQMHGGER